MSTAQCWLSWFFCLILFRNRKKIAKYKAAAVAQKHGEELQSVPQDSKPPPSDDSPLLANKPSPSNSDVVDLKAGNIVVTWKDGNVSQLFQSASTDDDNMTPDDKVNMMEWEVQILTNKSSWIYMCINPVVIFYISV